MAHLTEEQEYLLLGKISGTLTPEESLEVEQLLKEDITVQQAYSDLVKELPAYQVTNSFSQLNQKGYWKDITAEFEQRGDTPARIRSIFYRRLAAASIILLIATGGWLYYQYQPKNKSDQPSGAFTALKKSGVELKLANGKIINLSTEKGKLEENGTQLVNANKSLFYTITGKEPEGLNRVTVPTGMDYKISLNDGSQIWLNSATKLDFPFAFSGNTREVTINGEAYLQVAKDPAKPFIVHLPGSTVHVTGTEFNVNTYDSGTVKVALVEGSVNMETATGKLKLLPGKEAVYQQGENIQQRNFNPKFVLSWRKGQYYFDEATLQEISKVVPRWFGMEVIIDNPAINTKKFVGILDRNQPIAVFQDDLKAISGINSYVDDNNVLHFK